jgi:Protein of unknown function (DUF2630)
VVESAKGTTAIAARRETLMDDQDVIDRINELAHEEHQLYERASEEEEGLSVQERERMKWLEVRLDQCWDLLHQRRARRNAGLDPKQAQVRDERTVEGYVG